MPAKKTSSAPKAALVSLDLQGERLYSDLIGKHVVVRSSPSGVWMGRLDAVDGRSVRLIDARRACNWSGAASCSGLAVQGPSPSSTFPSAVAVAIVHECCEILAATPAAVARWQAVAPWVA